MGHPDSVGLHRMALSIVIVAYIACANRINRMGHTQTQTNKQTHKYTHVYASREE